MLVAPAVAAPPELFVRTQSWDTHEETGPWLPLASAPSFNYLGGYEIGYRLQASDFQTAALTITGVPDGAPTQPSNATPYCVGRNGTAGEIQSAGAELQFEGSGAYTVKVSVRPDREAPPTACRRASPTPARSPSTRRSRRHWPARR